MKKILSPKGIFVLLTLIVIFLFGAIFLLFQNIKSESENSSESQNKIDLSTKQNQYVQSLQESLQSANSSIAEVNNSILSSDGDVGLIEQLENVAKDNGLGIIIDSLAVQDIPNVTSDNLTSLDIRASTQGDWAGTIAFLTKLESLPFVMRIEKIDLANSSDNPQNLPAGAKTTQTWQITFEIRVLEDK